MHLRRRQPDRNRMALNRWMCIYDSRLSPHGPLTAGQTRVTTSPVPVGAVAQVVNTTVTGTTGSGYVSLVPSFPPTSMVNWYASPTTRANGSIVPGGFLDWYHNTVWTQLGGSDSTHYILDVSGYFR